jgi:O-antigen ligase
MAYATLAPITANNRLAAAPVSAPVRTPTRLFLFGVGVAMALSSVVLVEPAPVDALVMGLLTVGFLTGIIGLRGVKPVAAIPLALFAVANIISLYDPLSRTRATWYVLVTFYLCLSWPFFIGVMWTYGTRGMNTMIKTYSFAAMFCIVPGLLSYFHIIGFQKYLLLSGRPKGTFKDPNVYGPYLIPVALFAIAGLISRRSGRKAALFHTSIVLICTVGIFLSYSRACWINYAASLIAYLFFAFTFRAAGSPAPFPFSRILLLFAGLLLCVSAVLRVPEVQDMMSMRVTSTGFQGYDRDRFRTQRMALQSALDRPFGIGPGQAELTFHYATHSSYLRVLSENGFIGLAGFVVFIIVCLCRGLVMGWKTHDTYWQKIFFIASACIIGHIINSAVVDTVHWRHLWFILALPWYNPDRALDQMRLSWRNRLEGAAKYRIR